MKEHRRAFCNSHPQTVFRDLDAKHGFSTARIRRRQDNRFNAMLNESYGGRHAIRNYLTQGKLVNRIDV